MKGMTMTTTATQTQTTLTPRLRDIADKVTALSKMSHASGFSTKRTICELLSPLSTEELIAVAMYSQAETKSETTR